MRTGQEETLNKFVNNEGITAAIEMARSRERNGETALLITIAQSFKGMFYHLIKYLDAPIEQTGRFLWNGKEYPEITRLLAAIISNQHFFVQYLLQKQEKKIRQVDKLVMLGWTRLRIRSKKPYFSSSLESNESTSSCPSESTTIGDSYHSYTIGTEPVANGSLQLWHKIEALKLVGSVYILYSPYTALYYGIPCLKEALVLHQSIDDGQSEIPNISQPHFDHDRNVLGNTCEIATIEQLEQLADDYPRLFIHAFNVSQRILNQMI